MAHGYLGSAFAVGYLLFLVGACVDRYVLVNELVKQYTEGATTIPTVNRTETSKFGVFTSTLVGGTGYVRTIQNRNSYIDCTDGYYIADVLSSTSDMCQTECNARKAFTGIGLAFGFIAVLTLWNMERWALISTRRAVHMVAFCGLVCVVSLIIILSLTGKSMHEHAQTSVLTPAAGQSYEIFTPEWGVCSYQLNLTSNAVDVPLSPGDRSPSYGSSFVLGIIAVIVMGLSSFFTFVIGFRLDNMGGYGNGESMQSFLN